MKVNGNMVKEMDTELVYFKMGVSMMEIGLMEKCMALGIFIM